MEPRSIDLTGCDGNALRALVWSDEGVPLVLVHGYGNEAHIWDDFAPVVAPYYRTIALDQRGHGASAWDPERRYAYDSLVGDLEAALEQLDVERLVLVGHSLGGRVSTLFAGAHPERLAGLVLVDIGPENDPRGVSRIRMDMEKQADASFATVAEYERMLSIAYPAAQPHALRRMAEHGVKKRDDGRLVRVTDPAFHAGRGDMSEAEMEAAEAETARRLREALGKIACPTLVVRGAASDILSPETADEMVDELLPNATLAVVGQASHSVMTDNPEGFAEAVSKFALGE